MATLPTYFCTRCGVLMGETAALSHTCDAGRIPDDNEEFEMEFVP
jgi:hypothetical protein